jgi:sugar/nucleoside kinase (ribokinase family)
MVEDTATYDVATVGNYTKDTVVTPAGTRHVDGGGVRYSAFAAVGLGCRVAVITRLASRDSHVVDALEAAGIDVLPVFTPESTLMRLEYPTTNVDQRVLTVAATAGSITCEQVRAVSARTFLISPSIRGEVPIDVIREIRDKGSTIALDVQGFVRIRRPDGRLEHAAWPERSDVLGLVDILKADAVEAESITGESDPATAARAMAELGPREIVLTHRDGLLVLADGAVHEAPFHPRELVGRSGRGDTCLGSYVATRLTVPPPEATVWAAAVTSLKMEADGPFQSDIDEVAKLIETKYGMKPEISMSRSHATKSNNTGAYGPQKAQGGQRI